MRRDALTWDESYEKASELLASEGSPAAGDPQTVIKKGYQRVQRALRAGRGGKYFFLKDRRYRDLG